MYKKILLVSLSSLFLVGCGQDKLDDIEPLEVNTGDNIQIMEDQNDFGSDSDNIRPSVIGPSSSPAVNGPTTPPPSR